MSVNEILKKLDDAGENIISLHHVKKVFKKREQISHKGTYGKLLVCGGSKGLTGAACLACKASMRTGSGLVTLACAEELNDIFEVKLTEVMTYPLRSKNGVIKGSEKYRLTRKANESTALLIGCGLSCEEDIADLVKYVINNVTCPIILDADALNVISQDPDILKMAKNPPIITPHMGEFSRLVKKSVEEIFENKEKLSQEFASEYGCVVVLKSHETIVTTPDGRVHTNILGNPGMASGGCGDVLAGIIASLVAQGNSMQDSALAGVFIHSLAGDVAKEKFGEYSLIASDIINCLAPSIMALADI